MLVWHAGLAWSLRAARRVTLATPTAPRCVATRAPRDDVSTTTRASTEALRNVLLERLRRDYRSLPSKALYGVFAQASRPLADDAPPPSEPGPVPAGGPSASGQGALEAHLGRWVRYELATRFSALSQTEVSSALGFVALEFDRIQRDSGSFAVATEAPSTKRFDEQSAPSSGLLRRPSSSYKRVPPEKTTPPRATAPSTAEMAGLADDLAGAHASVRRERESTSTPRARSATPDAPKAPETHSTWVRGTKVDFGCEWTPREQSAELQFESASDLATFALELREKHEVTLPLSPPPLERTAVRLSIGVRSDEQRHALRANVARISGATALRVSSLPAPLGRIAQREIEARAASHRSVDTGLKETVSERPALADSGASRPTRSVARGDRGSSRRTTAPPVAPETFDRTPSTRTPTGPQSTAQRGASRRRRAAARRATGSMRAQLERVTGGRATPRDATPVGTKSAAEHYVRSSSATRRRRSGMHEAVPPEAPEHTAASQEAGSPSSAPEVAESPDPSRSQTGTFSSLQDAEASRVDHPTVREQRPTTSAPPIVSGPASESRDRTQRDSSPAGFDHVDSWKRDKTPSSVRRRPLTVDPSFGEELGTESGTSSEGGAAAVMLALASAYPAVSLRMVVGGARWRALFREDLLLDIRQEPEDPRFDIVRLVRESGLCSERDLGGALDDADRNGVTLLDQLGRGRVLRYREIDALQGSRIKMMLHYLGRARLDRWEAVGFDFVELVGPPPVEFAAEAWRSVMEAVDALPVQQVEQALSAHMGARPKYRRAARLTPRSLRMSAKEEKFVDAVLNGEQSVRQSIARSPLRRRASLCIVLALDRIGMIEWEVVDAHVARVQKAMPAIRERLAAAGSANPFSLIGAHWSSDEVLLLEAWRAAIQSLDLTFVVEHARDGDHEAATALHQKLTEARDRLRTREMREGARRTLCDDFERRAAVQLYAKQADLALFKKDVRQAADSLRRMVELDPRQTKAARQLEAVRQLDDSL